jgi:hypothetical protein
VQSTPFPLPALRRQAPRCAVGQGQGEGGEGGTPSPRARSRAPPTSAPFAKKIGSKTRSRLCSTSKPSQTVGEPGAACGVSELLGHGCCS